MKEFLSPQFIFSEGGDDNKENRPEDNFEADPVILADQLFEAIKNKNIADKGYFGHAHILDKIRDDIRRLARKLAEEGGSSDPDSDSVRISRLVDNEFDIKFVPGGMTNGFAEQKLEAGGRVLINGYYTEEKDFVVPEGENLKGDLEWAYKSFYDKIKELVR